MTAATKRRPARVVSGTHKSDTRTWLPAPRWRDTPACAGMDPETFFPERRERRAIAAAKQVRMACPVIDQCHEYAKRMSLGPENHRANGVRGGRYWWCAPPRSKWKNSPGCRGRRTRPGCG